MEPAYQQLTIDKNKESFLCFPVNSPKFGFHWHYHPEYEITYVVNGKGTRLVGDSSQEFENHDLIFLGSNLPHTWITHDDFATYGKDMQVLVLQFGGEIIDKRVKEMVEFNNIEQLLKASSRGLNFPIETRISAGKLLTQISEATGLRRYNLLLETLDLLGSSKFDSLSSEFYAPNFSKTNETRIGKVFEHIHEHYNRSLSIHELADVASMNEAAFCRFFKKTTGKSAINYINELRIGKACNLLNDPNLAITDIAFQTGFNNITHFNRTFLKSKGTSPSQYKKVYSNV